MNIVLTGYMASGKTTLGKKISELKGMKMIDTDELISKKANMSISDMFSRFGEVHFRRVESDVIKEVSKLDKVVIATGGGTVLNPKNIDVLRENGVIVNLAPDEETIKRRLSGKDSTRPLVTGSSIEDILKRYRDRKPYYDNCDVKIEITLDMTVHDTAEQILKEVEV